MTGVRQQKVIAAIVVAAGRGERMAAAAGDVPKQYRLLAGTPVLRRSIDALLALPEIALVLPVIHADHGGLYAGLGVTDPRALGPVTGGADRQASVRAGLEALAPHRPDLVLIHDAARPLIDSALVRGVIAGLANEAAALPVVPVTDTIKRSLDGVSVTATEDRATLYAAQTPQGFRFPQILAAHLRASRLPRGFTDDAAIAEWAGLAVALTTGSARNIKLTLPDDFARAERLIGGSMETRIGSGLDVHPFAPGDAVWLGGVKIAHTHALAGHSDADAGLHAITDAVYGALGEGDIGTHFPPSDPRWKGAPSRLFLEHAAGLVSERGGRIVNVDLTIVCEAPRIGPHVAAMKSAIADMCGITPDRVAVKATTSEQLGFTGRREGVLAMATASVALPEGR